MEKAKGSIGWKDVENERLPLTRLPKRVVWSCGRSPKEYQSASFRTLHCPVYKAHNSLLPCADLYFPPVKTHDTFPLRLNGREIP